MTAHVNHLQEQQLQATHAVTANENRPPVKAPEQIDHPRVEATTQTVVPPEVKLPEHGPHAPITQPTTKLEAPTLPNQMPETHQHTKPEKVCMGSDLVVDPKDMAQAEKKLFATLLHEIDPKLQNNLTLRLSNEICASPDEDKIASLKITLMGPMLDSNYALISSQFLGALREHAVLGKYLKDERTNTLNHITDENGVSSLEFNLEGLTLAEYKHVIDALAKGEKHKTLHTLYDQHQDMQPGPTGTPAPGPQPGPTGTPAPGPQPGPVSADAVIAANDSVVPAQLTPANAPELQIAAEQTPIPAQLPAPVSHIAVPANDQGPLVSTVQQAVNL